MMKPWLAPFLGLGFNKRKELPQLYVLYVVLFSLELCLWSRSALQFLTSLQKMTSYPWLRKLGLSLLFSITNPPLQSLAKNMRSWMFSKPSIKNHRTASLCGIYLWFLMRCIHLSPLSTFWMCIKLNSKFSTNLGTRWFHGVLCRLVLYHFSLQRSTATLGQRSEASLDSRRSFMQAFWDSRSKARILQSTR